MHALPAFAALCLLAASALAQSTPAATADQFDSAPLDPAAYPLYRHPVNRDRMYDFYAKQARRALAQGTLPDSLPAYPGLDGGKYGH